MIAQRLVRILCERCKVSRRLTGADLAEDPRYAVLGLQAGEIVHEGGGCERCGGTGYRGRTGVFEVLDATDDVRALIGGRSDSGTIARAAREDDHVRGCGRQVSRRNDLGRRSAARHHGALSHAEFSLPCPDPERRTGERLDLGADGRRSRASDRLSASPFR